MRKKVLLDILMLILFLVIMDYRFTKNVPHEIISALWLPLFFLHLYWNKGWFTGLKKGKWPPFRILLTVVDVLLLASFVAAMLSGCLDSRFIFRELLPIPDWMHRIRLSHLTHHFTPRVVLIFIGLHLGLHWQSWWNGLKKLGGITEDSTLCKGLSLITPLLILSLGVYGSFAYHIGGRLLLERLKDVPMDYNLLPFAFWHLMIIGLYTVIGHYAGKLFKQRH